MSQTNPFSRRALLAGTTMAAVAAAARSLPRSARAQAKVSKAVAQYQNRPNGQQRCEICVNFQPPNQCRFVAGDISTQGWCQFFAARDNAR